MTEDGDGATLLLILSVFIGGAASASYTVDMIPWFMTPIMFLGGALAGLILFAIVLVWFMIPVAVIRQ